MNAEQWDAMRCVLIEVLAERQRQHAMHGEQDLPPGFGRRVKFEDLLDQCRQKQAEGKPTWTNVLLEEVCEAVLAADPAALRAELIQVAAVAVQWVEAIDRANPRQTHEAAPGSTKWATAGAGEGGDAPARFCAVVGFGTCRDPSHHLAPAARDAPGWDGNGSPPCE